MPARYLPLRVSFALFAGLTVFTLGSAGCSQSQAPLAVLERAQSLTLYSIDGRGCCDDSKVEKPKTEETFHGIPVMGKVEIKDAGKRKELIAAFRKGVEKKDVAKEMAACFHPRHAIRVVEDGKTFDYVICFQCSQFDFWAGEHWRRIAVSNDPKATFNQFLKDANLVIVPEDKPGDTKE